MTGSQQLILAEGAGGAVAANYIEDVFSTWLYTGNGTSQTITTGIDLSTYGGLLWIKNRNTLTYNHILSDTTQPVSKFLYSNSTSALDTDSSYITARGTSGFTVGSGNPTNYSGITFVSWTFRKQPKFFDVVTYTGNGSNRTIAHNLGSVPGCIIVKKTSAAQDWLVYHRSLGANGIISLNSTAASSIDATTWNNTTPTSTVFSVGATSDVNNNGATYVAYLFAHDAGGFGLTGTDNVISCGSYTGNGSTSGPTITLGYEPQWVLIKESSAAGNQWVLFDNMRGMPVGSNDNYLFPNLSNAESSAYDLITPTATGFSLAQSLGIVNASGSTYIYIAIRRGPMKTPTTGTSVFTPAFASSSGTYTAVAGFAVDLDIYKDKSGSTGFTWDRLRGSSGYLLTTSTAAEVSDSNGRFDSNTSFIYNTSGNFSSYINWMFRRAPGFFDVVCYTGNGTFGATNHNLGVIPELTIYKKRSGTAENWGVIYYLSSISYRFGNLNLTDAFTTYTNDPAVAGLFSSTQFCKYYDTSGQTYVAYLFATVAGVSKVGTYTGTGALQTVNCGFTGGARFVLIKRTDSTGDWWVYDSARGITSGNDPYLLMNSTAAEVTGTNYVDTTSVGFQVTAAAPAGLNANGGTYIFLAIA